MGSRIASHFIKLLFGYSVTGTWFAEPTLLNSSHPDVSPCFQDTVLSWLPLLYLWLVVPFYICYMKKHDHGCIPASLLNKTKIVLSLLLVVAPLIEVGFTIGQIIRASQQVVPTHLVTPAFVALTMILVVFIICTEKNRGRHTSGILFCFWLLIAICGIPEFSSKILAASEETDILRFVMFYVFYALVLAQLVCFSIADRQPPYSPVRSQKHPCPEASASFLSGLMFSWFTCMVMRGYKKALTTKDLWDLLVQDQAAAVVPRFMKEWAKERYPQPSSRQRKRRKLRVPAESTRFTQSNSTGYDRCRNRNPEIDPKASLVKALVRTFGRIFILGSFLRLLTDILVFASPELLKRLIRYTEDKSIHQWQGYVYVFLILLAAVLQTILLHQYNHIANRVGMHVRTAIIGAVYQKSLLLSNTARRSATIGEIVNLMSVDTQRCLDLCINIDTLWSSLFKIIISQYLLWRILGPSVLAGLAVMILLIPINGFIAVNIRKFQAKQMEAKDLRIKMMNEILNGIKVLKLYAWETSFQDKVMTIRKHEVKLMLKAGCFSAVLTFIWTSAPFFVLLATFAIYVSANESNFLDAEKAFVSLSLFNILRFPLAMFPLSISQVIQASISVKRLQRFLKSDELDPSNVLTHTKDIDQAISVDNAEFSWAKGESSVLRNISMDIRDGSLIAIVGQVGSGKSSLLSALLGEMEKLQGVVAVQGSVAYIPQQAWIQNASLRDNVLFCQPLIEDKYQQVIESCALVPDLKMLPGGDLTEIGEKGINLSGGQKQRVSLARAVYNDADIYLLDDPLSAVDSHVGKHIFENVIGPEGLLRKKTRILVTHGIGFLPQVDHIIVLVNGEITEAGSYSELLSYDKAFAEFLRNYSNEQTETSNFQPQGMSLAQQKAILGEESTSSLAMLADEVQSLKLNQSYRSFSVSEDSEPDMESHRIRSLDKRGKKTATLAEDGDTLIEEEVSQIGRVKMSVFVSYIRAIGFITFFLVLFFFGLNNLTAVLANVWLSKWSSEAPVNGSLPKDVQDRYLNVYTVLGVVQSVMLFIAGVFLAIGNLRAARTLYRRMLINILRAPMAFFDTTPMGRILNRFSKDTNVIDDALPIHLASFLSVVMRILTTLGVITWSTPVFSSIIVPIAILYYFVQRFYIGTSRQLKRLESVSRSPIYSHFSETITGTSSIRAYKRSEAFILQNEMLVDNNQLTYYPSVCAHRWVGVRLELLGSVLVFFAALFAVIGRNYISSGIVGLSVSYALQTTMALTWLVNVSCDLETNVVAVERVNEYSEIKTEAAAVIADHRPDKEWPSQGNVEIDKYCVRYRDGLDLVLKGITCTFKAKEKVGIVGRTGAGKSSLTLSLFRILEAAGGSIKIDDLDISTIGLHDLRSRITIIPQDPVLFAGTLRMNLDPFNQHSDDEIWDVLQHSHLHEFVSDLNEKLEYECLEGGENLSLGQRQLICLARALLRKTKILVLDEATAAVDLETDDLIQATIRTEFEDCTVITIAHRLNTVMDSTRILVLDEGTVAEFDEPTRLLELKGIFYTMAKDAGLA